MTNNTSHDDHLLHETLNALAVVEMLAQRLALLNEISLELNLVTDLAEMAQVIAVRGAALLDCDWVGLSVVHNNSHHLFTDSPLSAEVSSLLSLSPELLFIKTVPQDTHFLISLNLPTGQADVDNYLAEKQQLRSVAVSPMLAREQIVGFLWVGSQSVHGNELIDEGFLRQVTVMVAAVVDNYQLLQQSRQTEQAFAKLAVELEKVTHISTITSTILGTTQLLQQIVSLTQEKFNLYHTQIFIFNDLDNELVLQAASGQLGQHLIAARWHIPLQATDLLVAKAAQDKVGLLASEVVPPSPLLPETRSQIALPLMLGQRVLGVLDLQSAEAHYFTPTDLRVYQALAAQIAVALQNANLYEQAQQALLATETFYEITARLNVTTHLDDIITAVIPSHILASAQGVGLFIFEFNEAQQPEYTVCKSVWSAENAPVVTVGMRFHLSEFPFNRLWLTNPHEAVLVEDVTTSALLDANSRELFQRLQVGAVALIPLQVGARWIGLVIVRWVSPYQFLARDKQLFTLVSNQAAVRVDNLLLLEATQARANQLQWLAMIEVTLSQATDEAEILTAVTMCFDLAEMNFTGWLQYLDLDEQGRPVELRNMAIWHDGIVVADDPELTQVYAVQDLPLRSLWLQVHNDIVFLPDVATDDRLDDGMRQELARFNFAAIVLLPLWSSNHWQGIVVFGWDKPHKFSANEEFYLRRLLEPLAAIVASRRATVRQLSLLIITEKLYQASLRINAAMNMQEILEALIETMPIPAVNQALLLKFNYDVAAKFQESLVIANWYRGSGTPPLPIGANYPHEIMTSLKILGSQTPLMFDEFPLEQQQVGTLAALPLWVASRQLGVLLLISEAVHAFTLHDMQPYITLAGQIAIALENKLLLADAQAKVERERILREVTAQIRRALDVDTVMRTATRKIAQTFGRKTFIKLENQSQSGSGE